MKIEDLTTYLSDNGYPLLRRCSNCVFWDKAGKIDEKQIGYCNLKTIYFAFTLEPSVHCLTKEFYLCQGHKFVDEEDLKQTRQPVKIRDILKRKWELKKNVQLSRRKEQP